MSGSGSAAPAPGGSPAPGLSSFEDNRIPPLSVGEGITQLSSSPPMVSNAMDKNLDKAASLLDDMNMEERIGYKAEFEGLKSNVDRIAKEPSPDKYEGAPAPGKSDKKPFDEPIKRTTS